MSVSLVDRLEAEGVTLNPAAKDGLAPQIEVRSGRSWIHRPDDRLVSLSGLLVTSKDTEVVGTVRRLTARDNFDRSDTEASDVSFDNEKFKSWAILVRAAIVKSIFVARNAAECSTDDILGFSQIELQAAASPGFRNIGLLTRFALDFHASIFPNQPTPAVKSVGVVCLEADLPLSISSQIRLV